MKQRRGYDWGRLSVVCFGSIARLFLFCWVCTIPNATAIASDDLTFEFREKFLYDSNPLRGLESETTLWGSETAFIAGYKVQGNDRQGSFRASLEPNIFNDSNFNSTDAELRGQIQMQTSLLNTELSGYIRRDTIRLAEITNFGLAANNQRRHSWELNPVISRSLSQRSVLSLSGRVFERRFEGGAGFDNYRVVSLQPNVAYDISQRFTLALSAQARRFRSLEGPQIADTVGPFIGFEYRLSPPLMLDANIGYIATRFQDFTPGADTWEYSPSFTINLTYDGPKDRISVGASRTRQSFANGTEADLNNIYGDYTYGIRSDLSLKASARYQVTQQPPASLANLEAAWQQSIALTYDPADRWQVKAVQTHRSETFSNVEQSADRTQFYLSLSYAFDKTGNGKR